MNKHEQFDENNKAVLACHIVQGVEGCDYCKKQMECELFHKLTVSYMKTLSSDDCWMGECCFNFKSDKCTITM